MTTHFRYGQVDGLTGPACLVLREGDVLTRQVGDVDCAGCLDAVFENIQPTKPTPPSLAADAAARNVHEFDYHHSMPRGIGPQIVGICRCGNERDDPIHVGQPEAFTEIPWNGNMHIRHGLLNRPICCNQLPLGDRMEHTTDGDVGDGVNCAECLRLHHRRIGYAVAQHEAEVAARINQLTRAVFELQQVVFNLGGGQPTQLVNLEELR